MLSKKLLKCAVAAVAVLSLSGCVSYDEIAEDEPKTLVTAGEQTKYLNLMEDMFNAFYWNYASDSVEFFETQVPDKDTDFGASALASSEDAGYDLSRYAGRNMLCATVDLSFYNGNNAGTAYVYLLNNSVTGVYYVSVNNPNTAYSLNDRNVFTSYADFKAFETDAPMRELNGYDINFLKQGFTSEGDNGRGSFMTSVIVNGRAYICTINGTRVDTFALNYDEDTVVIDCAVSSQRDSYDYIAVILGHSTELNESAETNLTVSDRIELLDKQGNFLAEIPIEGKGYSFIGFDGEYIVVGQNGFLDYYRGVTKEKSVYVGCEVTDAKKCDFDGDGTDEYLVTDGLDLYVFALNGDNMSLIWRTNISTKFFDGNIYVGDLNGDGVSEIYLADINGLGIRYTLTEKGIKYSTIDTGGMYFAADFNMDGKSDYIESTGEDSQNARLYLSE